MERILLRNTDSPDSAEIGEYERSGGYRALARALDLSPQEIVKQVQESGLRGRGGAGFPTGHKWGFSLAAVGSPRYLICNADEGEPGTFKDKVILEQNPHLLIEGMAISCHALGVERAWIYLRREYPRARATLEKAITQATGRGFLGESVNGKDLAIHISVFQGAGAYICGEETALIESLEGHRGQPRIKPPFPVTVGVWGKPTVVNNVETLANIPYIVERGGAAFASIGPHGSPGTKLFCISGAVARPGVYELPMGVNLQEIIHEHAGGPRNGRKLKAVIPGGISTQVLPASRFDCRMDFESLREAGSALGSGAIIVIDEDTCMVRVAHRALRFFSHESCGKCVPCREGTSWLERILARIEAGAGRAGDLELIRQVSEGISGTTFCPLGDGAASATLAFLEHFRHEFVEHVEGRTCRIAERAARPA